MDVTWYLSVVAFAIAMSFTPGPNNMMVSASGANYGFRRTLPHMLGVSIGFPAMLLAIALFGQTLLADPRVHGVLKWVGIAYLLWLAWHIAVAEPVPPAERDADPSAAHGRPLSFVQAALFQWVNPKAWIIASGALAAYAGSGGGGVRTAIWLALLFALASLGSVVLWTMIGVGAARILRTARALKIFNHAMAALLVLSLIPIVLE